MAEPPECPECVKLRAAYKALRRNLARRNNEAKELRTHLDGILKFLKAGWDEEEQHFDSYLAIEETGGSRTLHWCSGLIEELEELLDPDVKYAPFDPPKETDGNRAAPPSDPAQTS